MIIIAVIIIIIIASMVNHAFFVVVVFHQFQHPEVMVSFCSFHVQGLLPQFPEFVLTPVFFKN